MSAGWALFKDPTVGQHHFSFEWNERRASGGVSEAIVRATLTALGVNFVPTGQSRDSLLPMLRAAGGRRPDAVLAADMNKYIALIDAKYHAKFHKRYLRLTVEEVMKYRLLQSCIECLWPMAAVRTYFFVYPSEMAGEGLAIVNLLDVLHGTSCRLGNDKAVAVDLTGKFVPPMVGGAS